MPLTLALSILIKKKPGATARPGRRHFTPTLKVEVDHVKVDNEALLDRVIKEKELLLLPGGDGFVLDENLKKERVLTLLDRLFDSDTALAKLKLPIHKPPDCYMLVYSGPGDDGNWMFAEEKVFLHEILERWHAAKHYERGACLFILSDCDKSGLWIQQADQLDGSAHVFLQASCGAGELRGGGKSGHEEHFMKHWCNVQLGLANEDQVRPHLEQIGQGGVSAFAPYGFNFPVVHWAKPLQCIGDRVDKRGTEEELMPFMHFLEEATRKAEQLQPLTNMPVATERPRLFAAEQVEMQPSKRAEQAFLMARTSPMLAEQALPVWGRREPPTVLLGNIDLEQIVVALRRYVLHEQISVLAVQLLWRLSWHEEYRSPVVQAGALETVLKALELHIHNPALVCAGCGLVCRLRVTAGFRHKVLAVRGIETLVMAMRHQAEKADVQRFGCVALNVIAAPPDPATSHESGELGGPPQLSNTSDAVDVCVAALEGPVGNVPDVAIAAMGAASGLLHLDETARPGGVLDQRKSVAPGGAGPGADTPAMDRMMDLVPLVKAVAKVMSVHVEDPAVMRQGCQLVDALANGRYKGALAKDHTSTTYPAQGYDLVKALLAGLHTHRDLDDVVWQIMATMSAITQLPALKSRLVAAGARSTLMHYPKTRNHEMPRWLDGALNPLLIRLGMAGRK